MTMAELANCARCNAVYVKNLQDICRNCYQEEESAFQTVYSFLRVRKNREAKLTEIVEATGIEESLITKFIREKRLLPVNFPNLSYPCARCGGGITSGSICIDCTRELKEDLEGFAETEALLHKRMESDSDASTYYAIEKHKK